MLDTSPEYIDFAIKLVTATILGGLIGMEREFHGRAAGLRTHIFVCAGSAIIMAGSQIIESTFTSQGAGSVFRIDPWRLAAGIVTGIGFLGGGTILKSNELIRGLTTAACIWFVAGIGILVGVGLYIPAAMGTFIGLLVLVGLDPIGHKIPSVKYSQVTVVSELEAAEETERKCMDILERASIMIQDISISADMETRQRTLVLHVRSRTLKNKHLILKEILTLPHVLRAGWQ